jgi:hypothetical protein
MTEVPRFYKPLYSRPFEQRKQLQENEIDEIIKELNPPDDLKEKIRVILSDITISENDLPDLIEQIKKDISKHKKEINYKPRLLTKDEINDIIDLIPDINTPVDNVMHFELLEIKNKLVEQLQYIEITPLGISKLKDEIIRQFYQAEITPGTAVGVRSAEAIGGPVTQMALNSFHASGLLKKITTGVDRINELIEVRTTLKNPSSVLIFKNKNLTVEDIYLTKRADIIGITVGDIIYTTKTKIDTPENIFEKDGEPDWYKTYKILIGNEFEKLNTDIMRLYFKIDMLYAHNITMEAISKSILEQNSDTVICVYSPLSKGILDIYPIENSIKIAMYAKANIGYTFLSTIVTNNLSNIYIKGVKNIKSLYPATKPLISVIIRYKKQKRDGRWRVILNKNEMKVTGIQQKNIIDFFNLLHIETINYDNFIIQMPKPGDNIDINQEYNFDMLPYEYINKVLTIDDNKSQEFRKEQINKYKNGEIKNIKSYHSDISDASKYIYGESDGINLIGLFLRDDIDNNYTISSSVLEIMEVLGVEAARSFLLAEFYENIILNGSYITFRHIELLVDSMTFIGKPISIKYSGLKQLGIDYFTLATSERSTSIFSEAAAIGSTEQITGPSAAIAVGGKVRVGQSYINNKLNIDEQKEIDDILNNDEFEVNINELTDAINDLDISIELDPTNIQSSSKIEVTEIKTRKIRTTGKPNAKDIPSANPPEHKVVSDILVKSIKDIGSIAVPPPSKGKVTIEPIKGLTSTTLKVEPEGKEPKFLTQVNRPDYKLPDITFKNTGLPQGVVQIIEESQNIKLPTLSEEKYEQLFLPTPPIKLPEIIKIKDVELPPIEPEIEALHVWNISNIPPPIYKEVKIYKGPIIHNNNAENNVYDEVELPQLIE